MNEKERKNLSNEAKLQEKTSETSQQDGKEESRKLGTYDIPGLEGVPTIKEINRMIEEFLKEDVL